MVVIFDGNSEIGAHAQSAIVDLICLRHSFGSRSVEDLKIIPFWSHYWFWDMFTSQNYEQIKKSNLYTQNSLKKTAKIKFVSTFV